MHGAQLRRHLGLPEATTLVVGGIIGASIFLVPGAVADATGHPWLALAVWLLAGLLSACAALAFAELGSAIPSTGGTYVHLKRAYRSEAIAYCFGWMMLFGYGSAAVAVVAIMASSYLLPLLRAALGWSPGQTQTAIAIILAITALNVLGVRQSGRTQVLLTIMKLSLIACLIAIPLALGEPDLEGFSSWPAPASAGAFAASIADGLILCFFSFSGVHFVTQVAGEMRSPQKDIPKAIFIGFVTVVTAYILLNTIYLTSMPFEALRGSTAVASDLMRAIVGDSGARFVSVAIVVSALAVLNAQLMSYPRVVFALANDGLLPAAIASVHPRTHTPWVAILILAACAIAYVASGTYQQILGAVAFVSHLFITLAVAGVFLLRAREPQLERPYRVWLYPATPLLFIAVSVAYLAMLIVSRPGQTLIGVAIVAIGIPVYLWRRAVLSAAARAGTGTPDHRTGIQGRPPLHEAAVRERGGSDR